MNRINKTLGTGGVAILCVLLLGGAVALAVEAANPGARQLLTPTAESQQTMPAPQTPPGAPMMGPAPMMRGMGPGMMMPHPRPCQGCAMDPMMHPMMGGMGMCRGMMGMRMLAAAKRDPKGVALMMRMRADMLRLRAQMLEGRAKVLEKYATEKAGAK
jgi:hypothetical protein